MSSNPRPTPLAAFRFCPRCGQADPLLDSPRSIRCPACDFRYFVNSAATVCGFVFYRDRLILTKRAKPPQQGYYDFPGGFMEWDENAETALQREVQEELGIQVHGLTYVCSNTNDYPFADVVYKLADFYFICRTDDIRTLKAQDDVADVLLVEPHAVDPTLFSFPSVQAAHRQLLDYLAIHGAPTCSPPSATA